MKTKKGFQKDYKTKYCKTISHIMQEKYKCLYLEQWKHDSLILAKAVGKKISSK